MTKISFKKVTVNGKGPQTIFIEGSRLTVTELEGYPKKDLLMKGAFVEKRPKFPRELLWIGIGSMLLAGLGVILIILYYYSKEDVLAINLMDGTELRVRGDEEKLKKIHYEIQKRCLKEKRSKKEEKGKEAPVPKGSAPSCPQCGSTHLYYEAGMTTGKKYHCKDCDYIGALVFEKD